MDPGDITLGILAGGRATRLEGHQKAWLQRDGMPQVQRWQRRFEGRVGAVLVSANRDLHRYRTLGMVPIPDRILPEDVGGGDAFSRLAAGEATEHPSAFLGPIAGIDALARACTTAWLLTLPVDLVDVNDCLLPSLAAAGGEGAWAEDDDGPQPLVALWRADRLDHATATAIAGGDLAVHRLQARLGMAAVRLHGVRLGNLNTFDDLASAGIALP